MWKFDKSVAGIFLEHARKHIPNYELVISKTVDVCNLKNKSSKIIDVGCATGHTLERLHQAGFNNLFGVDSSEDMLYFAPKGIATYYHSSSFPEEVFDIVIMNWTLHFIKDKAEYIKTVYKNLDQNGIFILSDKTNQDDIPKKFYYNYKKLAGVTEQEIVEKEKSLVGVMHINDVDWYLQTLKDVGFNKVYVMDANWCFTSFVCLK